MKIVIEYAPTEGERIARAWKDALRTLGIDSEIRVEDAPRAELGPYTGVIEPGMTFSWRKGEAPFQWVTRDGARGEVSRILITTDHRTLIAAIVDGVYSQISEDDFRRGAILL